MMPACTEKNNYQKCIKFACNYFQNSSASGGRRPPDPLRFCPIPNLLPPPLSETQKFNHLFESGSKAHKTKQTHRQKNKTDTQNKKDGNDRHNKTP